MVGGWRSGRERKLRTYIGRSGEAVARGPGLWAARLVSTENRSSLKRAYTPRASFFGTPLLSRVGFFSTMEEYPPRRPCDPVDTMRTDGESQLQCTVPSAGASSRPFVESRPHSCKLTIR